MSETDDTRGHTRLLRSRAATVKLLMTAVFLTLGGWLVYAAL